MVKEKFTVVDISGKHPHFPVPVKTKSGIVLFYKIAPMRDPYTFLDMEGHLEMGMLCLETRSLLKDSIREVPRTFGTGQTLGACKFSDDEFFVFFNSYHIHNWLGESGASVIAAYEWTVTSLGIHCMSILESDKGLRFGKPLPARTRDFPVANGYGTPVVIDKNILFPCDFNVDITGLAEKPWETTLLCSGDSGKSWSVLGMINMENENPEVPKLSKPFIALTSSNELICMMESNSSKKSLYIVRSHDGGASWSTPEPAGPEGTWHSLLTLRDGRIMLAYAPSDNSNSVCVILSEDGGKTWPESAREIVDDRSKSSSPTYTRSLQLEDDTVLLTYTACLSENKSRQVVCALLIP